MTRSLVALALFVLFTPALLPAAPEPLAPTFPFAMPAFDASPTAVDMSFLSPEPAGAHGPVRIVDGHFIDGSGKRLRLLGTNFTFANAFPPKEAAPKVAARLRKLGMNVVRFHHMDCYSAPRGIWLPDQKGLDPEQLDRLDWMIYQLKEHGVYSNLNLHVSRNYPGLPNGGERPFNYGKVLDNFHKPYIDLQHEYARMLLTHVNKYTGKPYASEPAIITVEINNENTLLGASWSALRTMPEPFLGDLTGQWRTWLRARYADSAVLRKAWGATSEPAGAEVLKNGDLAAGQEPWTFQRSPETQATVQAGAFGPDGKPGLQIETTKAGPLAWEFQLIQAGLKLEEGRIYTVSLQARAEPAKSVGLDVRLDQEPWTNCGLAEDLKLTPEWQSFTFSFRAHGTQPNHGRVTIGLRNQLGRFWVAGVSLKPGGVVGLGAEQSLEAGNIPLPPSNATEGQKSDFWAFLAETERAYVRDFVALLKNDLKVQAPIICTQASYGGLGGTYREAKLSDFTDMHSYWQHPVFPGRPWDPDNWRVGNTPMDGDAGGGTLYRLAMHRVAGKPFAVSEYDHPYPSFYSAEMFPMVASFGAFQDWDAIYQFDYGNTAAEEGLISGYFTMCSHPGKVAFAPIAALLFRGGAVAPGGAPAVLTVPETEVVPQLMQNGTNISGTWQAAGFKGDLPLTRPIAVRFTPGAGKVRIAAPAGRAAAGAITWKTELTGESLYTVNAPSVRVAAGTLGGRTVKLGDVQITMEKTPSNWASIAVAALDQRPLAESRRILVVACGRVENTNVGWNDARNSFGRKRGEAPTRAEGIPLRVTLPGKVKECRALDGTGKETVAVPVTAAGAGSVVALGPERETIWYVLSR